MIFQLPPVTLLLHLLLFHLVKIHKLLLKSSKIMNFLSLNWYITIFYYHYLIMTKIIILIPLHDLLL